MGDCNFAGRINGIGLLTGAGEFFILQDESKSRTLTLAMQLVQKPSSLFGRTRVLEGQIDEFLDKVVEAGLIFKSAVDTYLGHGACREFEDFLRDEEKVESRADNLRRAVETELYAQTLIPEARGDVLRLLEDMDNLINMYEGNLFRFSIQQPAIPRQFNDGFRQLTATVVTCVESAVASARAFFRDTQAVRDHNSKVMFYETQADTMSTSLQRQIFGHDLELAHKRHLAYFVEKIDIIANTAEDVADGLAIYAIKRKI